MSRVPLPVDWVAIREGYVLGLTSVELSKRFGVSDAHIRVRATRGGWPTPSRIKAARSAQGAASGSGGVGSSSPVSASGLAPQQMPIAANPSPPSALSAADLPDRFRNVAEVSKGQEIVSGMASDSLSEIAERHPLRLAKWVDERVKLALKTESVGVPSNWKELDTADRMLRRAVGLEKEGPVINLALFGSGSGVEAAGIEV